MGTIKQYDCQRGCEKEINESGDMKCTYKLSHTSETPKESS